MATKLKTNPNPDKLSKEEAMTTKPNPDSNNHANDNNKPPGEGSPTVPVAPKAGGALVSLEALATALNAVDTGSVLGRSGKPMLQFKRQGDGTWMYGQKHTIPEPGSHWAVNPASFKWGDICFGENNRPFERLVPVSKPKPDPAGRPNTGFEWHDQWAVDMKCVSGADAGVEVTFKASTIGGGQAVAGLIDVVRDRLNDNQHGGNVVPVVTLDKDGYSHQQYGKQWTPVLTVVDWMPMGGPASGPASPPPPKSPPSQAAAAEQPRRRRVG